VVASEQVTAQIRRAIDEREALPGERLPPPRDLAAELGVSINTVRRSLRLLCEEGLLVRRLGLRVSGGSEPVGLAARARGLLGVLELRRHGNATGHGRHGQRPPRP
jgi:DNA-binding transcriptional MocR family regulator